MKSLILILGAILTIFIILPDPAMAGSIKLTATCTIPAIPGVNSPMLEQENLSTPAQSNKTTQENAASNQEATSREQLPTIMQEESSPTRAANTAAPLLTRTLYTR